MDWPRLGGSTTYDWTLGQILPRSREEGCQQNLTEALSKEDTVYREGNLTMEEDTHMGLPKGNQPYGHLAQYRADRRPGRANTSTGPGARLLRPV